MHCFVTPWLSLCWSVSSISYVPLHDPSWFWHKFISLSKIIVFYVLSPVGSLSILSLIVSLICLLLMVIQSFSYVGVPFVGVLTSLSYLVHFWLFQYFQLPFFSSYASLLRLLHFYLSLQSMNSLLHFFLSYYPLLVPHLVFLVLVHSFGSLSLMVAFWYMHHLPFLFLLLIYILYIYYYLLCLCFNFIANHFEPIVLFFRSNNVCNDVSSSSSIIDTLGLLLGYLFNTLLYINLISD